jgi:hypothetical protein
MSSRKVRETPIACGDSRSVDEIGRPVHLIEQQQQPSPKEEHQVADAMSMALDELLCKARLGDDVDCLRWVRTLVQAVLESEVAQRVGAGPYGRTLERTGERNGHCASGAGIRWQAAYSCAVRGGVTAASSRRRWSRADGWNRRWWRCRRRMCGASRRVDERVQTLGIQGGGTSRVRPPCSELENAPAAIGAGTATASVASGL